MRFVLQGVGLSRREFVIAGALSIPPRAVAESRLDVRVLSIFNEINRIRRENRLGMLAWDDRVEEAARQHASNMARRNFFSHDDPVLGGLTARLDRLGIPWSYCAENIFQEHGHRDLAGVAVQNWMKSEGHRRNILNPNVTKTGIGLATRNDSSNWVDQIFIRPAERRVRTVG